MVGGGDFRQRLLAEHFRGDKDEHGPAQSAAKKKIEQRVTGRGKDRGQEDDGHKNDLGGLRSVWFATPGLYS